MKKIMFGVVLGACLTVGLKAMAQFTTITSPAKESRNLFKNFTMTEGQVLTLSATGQSNQSITIPDGKTAKVIARIFIEIQ
jgi:hypothetical protein